MHNQIFVTCPTPVFIFMIFNWQTVLPYKMLIKERERERENQPIQPQVVTAKKHPNVQL